MTHIVYKGESALMPDLLTGRIQCGFITVTSAKSFVRSGKIKALGVLTPQSSPSLPEAECVNDFETPAFINLVCNWMVFRSGRSPFSVG